MATNHAVMNQQAMQASAPFLDGRPASNLYDGSHPSAPSVGVETGLQAQSAIIGEQAAMMDKLRGILDRFEISIAAANDLVELQEYEMVIIADDSGSMGAPAEPSHMRKLGQPVRSRWHELMETVSQIMDIASCFDETGSDVFFLNREPVFNIRDSTQPDIVAAFAEQPRGTTPLTETLRDVVQRVTGEKKVLLFIMTDGEPNGGKNRFISEVKKAIASGRIKVQIMACTPDEEEVAWLNDLDHELLGVDVTDDYYSEKQEVLRSGLVTKFSRGDWCMKAMLGPVSKKFDAWDERTGKRGGSRVADCCCTVS